MFVHKDRFYFVTNLDSEVGTGINFVKPRFIETDYGLAIVSSVNSLKVLEYLENPDLELVIRRGLEFPPQPGFFIFNKENDGREFVVFFKSNSFMGKYSYQVVARRYLKDIGFIGGLFNDHNDKFLKAIITEDLPIEMFYTAFSKTFATGARGLEFMENAKGIALDEIFSHPYANGKKKLSEI